MEPKRFWQEKNIHIAFVASLVAKGFFALGEFAGGIALLFVSKVFLENLVGSITDDELATDPTDILSNALVHAVEHLSGDTQHFAALYLASHGLIKGLLIAALLKEKLWAYPLAIAVFALFIVYQVSRFVATHSFWMLALTVLDLAVIALTWHEYRYLLRTRVRRG